MPNRIKDVQHKRILLEFQGLQARYFPPKKFFPFSISSPLQPEMADDLVFRDHRKQVS